VAQKVAAVVITTPYLGRMVLSVEHLGSGGPRVVLLHGFTQTGRSWGPIAGDLAAEHEVVLVDLPGHGASADVRADLPGTADLVADIGGTAVYVGYSMGGRVALHLALAHPELVQGLVLLSATGGIDDDGERAARRAADEQLALGIERDGVDTFLARWLAQPMFAGLPDDPAALADRRRNTAAGLASSLRLTGTGTQEPLWGYLRALPMPVVALAGERDEKFVAAARRLGVCIGTNASVETIPDAGHAAHVERPAAFVSSVRAFLALHVW
jgi:2-succinyl-6-hydroxy-2,4-cyclohexadiene-1-carboxylate synthase